MLDLMIVNGLVYDGTGVPAVRKDIGIRGDRIEDVADLSKAESKELFNADGKMVCPGFIDAHSHSDAYLLIEPSSPSKIFQGITTEVIGNCGASAAPLTGSYKMPTDWRDMEYPGKWSSVSEYRSLLEQAKPGPNVLMLTGHSNLRAGVAGYDNRPVTSDELKKMGDLLEKAMDEGSRGLSTGLIYAPGMFSDKRELVELAKRAARRKGIYTSHMRSEVGGLLEAIDEALAIGSESGVRVEISHLKTSGRNNWHLADHAIEKIRNARKRGQEVAADRYPYLCGNTELDVVFPDWASEGGTHAVLSRLSDPGQRARLKEDLSRKRSPEDWGNIVIGSTYHPDNRRFRGMALTDIARNLGVEPVEAILYLVEKDKLKTSAFFFGMSEENMIKILAEPFVMIGTDASLRSPEGPLSKDHPHPRAYGAFPRFLRMAIDGKTVQVAEAVRKMTSLPAEQFGMKGRGKLAKGMFADVIVIDQKEINDVSEYADPHKLARGVELVVVNGTITMKEGQFTGQRSGRVL